MAQPDRLILVDGNALLYRAYYAIPSKLSNAAGLPTNSAASSAAAWRSLSEASLRRVRFKRNV